METIHIDSEYIQLNQALKMLGWVETGGDANECIDSGLVKVNNQVELRRRNKLYTGFTIEFDGNIAQIISSKLQTD